MGLTPVRCKVTEKLTGNYKYITMIFATDDPDEIYKNLSLASEGTEFTFEPEEEDMNILIKRKDDRKKYPIHDICWN